MEITLEDVLKDCPQNEVIVNDLIRAWSKINSTLYDHVVCSISGGSDSDIILDICTRCDRTEKIKYVWFDTGLEYQATKDHLKYLEDKYKIVIEVRKAIKPIPVACKEYGQPFLSKNVSEFMYRLQKHGFTWENDTYENLIVKYPKCQSALHWWCGENGDKSKFNIERNKWLKEFVTTNPPNFHISNKCCSWAKKKVAHNFIIEQNADLSIVGVRKAEGGVRAAAYKTCFSGHDDAADDYRPIWWYKDCDKTEYEDAFRVDHSKCYTEYGLVRTGCAGCPFGRDFEFELEVIKQHEPKLYVAVNNIFGESYRYTRKYKEFCKEMNVKERSNKKHQRMVLT